MRIMKHLDNVWSEFGETSLSLQKRQLVRLYCSIEFLSFTLFRWSFSPSLNFALISFLDWLLILLLPGAINLVPGAWKIKKKYFVVVKIVGNFSAVSRQNGYIFSIVLSRVAGSILSQKYDLFLWHETSWNNIHIGDLVICGHTNYSKVFLT